MLSHTVVQQTMSIENLDHNTKPCHGSSCFGLKRDTGLTNTRIVHGAMTPLLPLFFQCFQSPLGAIWNTIIYKLCNKLLNWMLNLETMSLCKSRYRCNHGQFLYPQLSHCTSVLLLNKRNTHTKIEATSNHSKDPCKDYFALCA